MRRSLLTADDHALIYADRRRPFDIAKGFRISQSQVTAIQRGAVWQPPDIRRQHDAFIRSLPCLRCRRGPSEAAHVRSGSHAGMKQKPSEEYLVPICHECHRTGRRAQHVIGEESFWAELGVGEPIAVGFDLWRVSGNRDMALPIIEFVWARIYVGTLLN